MKKKTTKVIDIILTVGIVLCLGLAGVFLYRNICYDEIVVSGNSMETTLHNGDFGLMKTTKYAINHIKRFDIVIVEVDNDTSNEHDIIKRVIGLPGEKIKIEANGDVLINGSIIEEPFLTVAKSNTYRPNAYGCFEEYVIPSDSYFCLGDNRGASADSRNRGALSKEHILGVLKVIYKEKCSESDNNACSTIKPRWF
ncbi:MAG: signal peptidase I [Erysipelotrichales bacterium]|nr:signal peptidase I [Erysipelotrichales bacterium]